MRPDCYLEFPVADLLLDSSAVRDALMAACRRHAPGRIVSICQLEDRFLAVCQETRPPVMPTSEVQIDEVEEPTLEVFQAHLQARWRGGYEPIGCISDRGNDGVLRRFLFTQR